MTFLSIKPLLTQTQTLNLHYSKYGLIHREKSFTFDLQQNLEFYENP